MKMMRTLKATFVLMLCLCWAGVGVSAEGISEADNKHYSEIIRNQSRLSPKLCRSIHSFGSGGDCSSLISLYINTPEELAAMCTGDSGKVYVLGSDIIIPPGWTPIGHSASGAGLAFKGSLDGQGHSITGLDMDVAGGAFGLFGRLEGANISNLVLADASMRIGGGACELAAGLLAGEAVGGIIRNVTVVGGSISVEEPGLTNVAIGGLIGHGVDLLLEDVCVTAEINKDGNPRKPGSNTINSHRVTQVLKTDYTDAVGEPGSNAIHPGQVMQGLMQNNSVDAVGRAGGDANRPAQTTQKPTHDNPISAAGGLAGRLRNSIVKSSTADAQIYTDAHAAGGIVGLAVDTSFHNSGTKSGVIKSKSAAGGFAGRLEGMGTVIECYSNADVTGAVAGGFAGQISGKVLPGNANHVLEVSLSSATGKTISNGGIAGGFVGQCEYALIKDSSAYGEVVGQNRAGGFVGQLSSFSRVIYAYAKGDVALVSGAVQSRAASITIGRDSKPPLSSAQMAGFAGGFVGELTNSACVEFSYSAGTVIAEAGLDTAAGGFAGLISASGTPNTITHCLSFAPWVVGDGYVHRFAGHAEHDGVNGCYALLGSMVVRNGSITHVLPSAFGADGADMSSAQVEDITKRLGWRRPAPR